MSGLLIDTHGAWLITLSTSFLGFVNCASITFICVLHIKIRKEISNLVNYFNFYIINNKFNFRKKLFARRHIKFKLFYIEHFQKLVFFLYFYIFYQFYYYFYVILA